MNLIGTVLAQIVSWAISLCLLVIPMGGVPQNVEYRSIANPRGQASIAEVSNHKSLRMLDETTRAGASAMLRTFLGSINNPDIDRSLLTRAIAAMPIRDESSSGNRTSSDGAPSFYKGIRDYQLFLLPTKTPDIYEFAATYAQANGKQMETKTGITYNAKTGELLIAEFASKFGSKRNINLNDIVFYNEVITWQQHLGFNKLYDFMAPMLLYDLDELRLMFPYDGKDWMFQFWKGSYTAVSNGAEIGIYEKPQSRKIAHYDCSDLMLPMQIKLFHGEKRMFTQSMEKTWWITAFQPGLKIKPKEMTLESTITFNDSKMQKLFVEQLRVQGDLVSKISVKGATVNFSW